MKIELRNLRNGVLEKRLKLGLGVWVSVVCIYIRGVILSWKDKSEGDNKSEWYKTDMELKRVIVCKWIIVSDRCSDGSSE